MSKRQKAKCIHNRTTLITDGMYGIMVSRTSKDVQAVFGNCKNRKVCRQEKTDQQVLEGNFNLF